MTYTVEIPTTDSWSDAQSDGALALSVPDDQDAFITLYDRYAERIERYVRSCIGDVGAAEDVVSTTFLQALTKIHLYNPARGSFAAWLFAIARNTINGHYRRRSIAEGPTRLETLQTAAFNPEQRVMQHEEDASLHAALLTLTANQRDAIALRYLGELSFAEVGQQLGKSEAAAKMLVRRGIDALRDRLQQEDQEP
jgi:RNA polymerase sigma-70 factor (ECF subfamily)